MENLTFINSFPHDSWVSNTHVPLGRVTSTEKSGLVVKKICLFRTESKIKSDRPSYNCLAATRSMVTSYDIKVGVSGKS